MKSKDAGWVQLHRSLRVHTLWRKERFTMGQAWVDILLRVNRTGGNLFFSVRGLAQDWHWSKSKTARFLLKLQDLGMIAVAPGERGASQLIVVNWRRYQPNSVSNTLGQKPGQQSTQLSEEPITLSPQNRDDRGDKTGTVQKEKKIKAKACQVEPEVEALFQLYAQLLGKTPRYRLTQKRAGHLRARLKEGRTREEFEVCFRALARSGWHRKQGFDDLEQVVRSTENFDKWLARAQAESSSSLPPEHPAHGHQRGETWETEVMRYRWDGNGNLYKASKSGGVWHFMEKV